MNRQSIYVDLLILAVGFCLGFTAGGLATMWWKDFVSRLLNRKK